ncbi:MAG: bifunctional metallophosphatase/5'-nucleotidase [Chlamydiales bacterium]|nr:bifunctional metallophosphatase/5'-nucleotidase [Chlamydiales bacterium]
MTTRCGQFASNIGMSIQHLDQSPFDDRISLISLEALKSRDCTLSRLEGLDRNFTILFTGDTHSYLEPSLTPFICELDPSLPRSFSEKPLGGVVRRIHYLEECRRLIGNPVLVLDAGDFLQGTPYFEEFEGVPEIEFMNRAGICVTTVGNHDFDKGWDHLEKLLKAGRFQSVCGNIFRENETSPCLPPYCLLQINDQNVAVVGIMGLDSWKSIAPSQRKGLRIENPTDTLDRVLPEIRPHVDLIILLSHSGIKDDRKLAKHPMVDLIIGGHSHTFMKQHEIIESPILDTTKKTPLFHSFRYGQLVGRIDITLLNRQLSDITSSLEYLDERYDISETDMNHSHAYLLKSYQEKLQEKFNEYLGDCVERLPSKDKMAQLIPLGIEIANILRRAGDANVGIIPSGSIKTGIERGPFTRGTIHQMLAHKEPLWTATIQGSLLLHLAKESQKRWGNQRTFQYAGMTVDVMKDDEIEVKVNDQKIDEKAFYKVAAPSFFFEREILDGDHNVLLELKNQVQSIEIREQDLRNALANIIREEGLKPWIIEKVKAAI